MLFESQLFCSLILSLRGLSRQPIANAGTVPSHAMGRRNKSDDDNCGVGVCRNDENFLIVKTALGDFEGVIVHAVDQSVFLGDAA